MSSQNPQSFNKFKTRLFTPHHFWNKSGEGFTLIELLVVISIIGLISSIVLVSMKGFREDARLAKSKKFSSSIQHILGAYAVGIWRFETINGGVTPDESGYGNNGTVNGDPTPIDSEIFPGTYGLSFDGSGDYVEVPSNTSLNLINLTIEYWMKPSTGSDSNWRYGHIRKYGSGSGRPYWTYGRVGSCCTFERRPDDGSYHALTTKKTNWDSSKWYHLVWVYNDGLWQVFIDGKFDNERNDVITPCTTNGKFEIVTNPYYFNGAIDEVRIYEQALSAAEIQKHYAEGAARHNIALK